MTLIFDSNVAGEAIQLCGIFTHELEAFTATLTKPQQNALHHSGFKASLGSWYQISDEQGLPSLMLYGKGEDKKWQDSLFGAMARKLPPAIYVLSEHDTPWLYLSWALGSYQFNRYLSSSSKTKKQAKLLLSDPNIVQAITPIIDGTKLARDLINTPANDLGPL